MESLESEFLVLGGGISGLMAARSLEDRGHEVALLERSPGLGGLTRTVQVDKYCFDYTGHFLHLRRYPSPADIPFAGLDNADWMRVDRRSVCYIADTFIPAPLQYNIGLLPEPERSRCIESYRNRPVMSGGQNPTFRDYVIAGFGEYLADLFLIPQNEKTMAIALNELSASALKRFFPKPDEVLVEAGIDQRPKAAEEYNSSFWYPRQGGIGQLPEGLARGLKQGFLNHEVVSIDPHAHRLNCRNGQEFSWQHIVSSLPLKVLCHCVKDETLHELAHDLSHSTTIAFNLGCYGETPDVLGGIHWVYVPDRSIPFYRVGLYSNISPGTCTPGHHTLYVIGSSSVSAVLTDRLVGLFSLVLLGAGASLIALLSGLAGNIRTIQLFSVGLLVLILITGTVFMYLIVGPGRRAYRRVRDRFPRKFVALLTSLFLYRHHPVPLLKAVFLSIVSHALIVISFILAAVLLKVPLGFGLHMILDPLAMLLNAVPLAPGGLGITESGFAYLYHMSGSNDGAAVALTGRFAQYIVFIAGGLWALFTVHRRVSQPEHLSAE